jgi:hypothetical protein
MPLDSPTPPPWIADLPTDSRGFHVPAEAGWESGEPRIALVDNDRSIALALRRACAVCGYEIPPGSLFYRAWGQDDAEHIRKFERERSHDDAGPCHLSCIVYSATVCPHLRSDRARLGKSSQINPGAERGREAAMIGFERTGVLLSQWPAGRPHPRPPLPMVAYVGLRKDIKYHEGSELHHLLGKAISKDEAIIDTSESRMYWTDSLEHIAALRGLLMTEVPAVRVREPDYSILVERTAPGARNVGPYDAFLL